VRTLLTVLALAAATALLGACASPARGAPAPVQSSEVTMPPSYRFEPTAIQVPAGTAVTFRNTDNFTHSVSVTSGGSFPYLNLPPGQSGQITFADPGEYAYVCTYHAQDMKGRVTVTAR
jgi:plastocyanin